MQNIQSSKRWVKISSLHRQKKSSKWRNGSKSGDTNQVLEKLWPVWWWITLWWCDKYITETFWLGVSFDYNQRVFYLPTLFSMNSSSLFRLGALSALMTGLSLIVLWLFHPANEIVYVTGTQWIIVHIFACLMSFFGFFGLTALYLKQSKESGWLWFLGFLFLNTWFALVLCFSFIEAALFPILAGQTPAFVGGVLGMFHSIKTGAELWVLPLLWNISGPLFILWGLFFGIATFRAKVFSRTAGLMLALGTGLAPLAALLPMVYQSKILAIAGVAFLCMGWGLLTKKEIQK